MERATIINTHDQLLAAGGGVAIGSSYVGDHSWYGWAVWIIDASGTTRVLDPKSHWSNRGCKVFSQLGRTEMTRAARKKAALEAAKRWAYETLGEQGPWKMNGMRDYVPERINKQFPIRKRKKETPTP